MRTGEAVHAEGAARRPDLVAVAVLAGFAGLRRVELHAQAWEDVDLKRGLLRVTATKKGTVAYRLVHLCPAAVEWLAGSERQKKDEQTGKTPLSPVWGVDRLRQLARETTPRIEVPGNARPPHAPDHAKRERITTAMK